MTRSLSVTFRRLRFRFDWALFGAMAAIVALGLVNLYSATRSSAHELFGQQLRWLVLGFVTFFAVAAIDYRFWLRLGYGLYGLGLAALVAVLAVGPVVKGSQRWLALGALRLQPAELMKVLLIVALAKHVQEEPFPELDSLRKAAIPTALILAPCVLVAREPDLGTACLAGLIGLSVVALTRMRAKTIALLAGVALVSAPLSWRFLLADYQKRRISTFLDPAADPSGAGWHSLQSIFAIGSGRLSGKGFLRGTQNQLQFLPEHWTDFPFSVWAEEWGFVGALALVGAYLFLILWVLNLAWEARDRFGAVVCLGVAALLFWHVAINVGMVTGLAPVVGVTLPLFSYGGSSLLTILIALGLAMSVSIRRFEY